MRIFHLLGLSIVISTILTTSFVAAEEHPVWNPGLEQAATGSLGSGTPPASIDALRTSLDAYLTMSDAQLRAQIGSMRGGAASNGERYARAQATYNLALLFHLTDDADPARRARVLLERYAEQFPGWSYQVCTGQCGVWTDWYHNDFDVSMLLALAFDLLAPPGMLADSEASIRELLVQIVQRDLEYRLYTFNWAFYRPLGFVIFGRVLDDPQLVRLGYWFYAKHMHEYYTHDGFPTEGTYSYHQQQTPRFVEERQAYYFDGYSDPVGYTHIPFDTRWDPSRIDNYDTDAMWAVHHERMVRSLRETTLPNGQFPILNDTKQYDRPYGGGPPDTSLLLGGLGHAVLAGGTGVDQTQARLDFSHTVGHRHRDALHLIYYGDKTETVGGTAYRYPDAAWNTSTLSQNLVVIDEAEQRGAYFVDYTMSPYVPGRAERTPVRRSLWDQSTENLHNDVLMWEPGFADFLTAQVVEVDALDAYQDHADRYRRMLALVHIEGDNYYLADFFRVRGGAQYDWTLHGGHAENTLELDLPSTGASGSLGQISFQEQATPDGPWSARFVHGDVTGRVMMTGAPNTTVYKATGPRYEYGGSQDHMVVRRTAARTDNVSFAAVHETYEDNPRAVAIEALSFGGESDALGVKVTLADGRVDYLLQSTDEGPDYVRHTVDTEELTFAGRFAHIRVDAEGAALSMYLVQGSELSYRENLLKSADGDYSHRGEVSAVERRESGAAENAFVVNPPLPGDATRWAGKTIRVTGGNGWSWAFRIERVEGARVITSDEPGFELDSGGMDRQYFPLQEYLGLERIEGPVRFLVAGSAVWENGDIRATRDPGPSAPDIDSDAGVIPDGHTGDPGSDTPDISDETSGADGGPADVGGNRGDRANDGCGCGMASNEPANWIFSLLLLALVVVRRQRKSA